MNNDLDSNSLELIEALASSHIFKSLDEVSRMYLCEQAEIKEITDQNIIEQGANSNEVFLLLAGQVRIWRDNSGEELELAILGRGALFGEVAAFTGQKRTANATALDKVTIAEISKEAIVSIMEHNDDLKKLLDRIILGRAKNTIDKINEPKS
jgi:CRP-like cAMP-binding protein